MNQGLEVVNLVDVAESDQVALTKSVESAHIALTNVLDFIEILRLPLPAELIVPVEGQVKVRVRQLKLEQSKTCCTSL